MGTHRLITRTRWAWALLLAAGSQFLGPLAGAANAFNSGVPLLPVNPPSAEISLAALAPCVDEPCPLPTEDLPTELLPVPVPVPSSTPTVPEVPTEDPTALPTVPPLPSESPSPEPLPTPPDCGTDSACAAQEVCGQAGVDCAPVVETLDCAQNGVGCPSDVAAVRSCALAPTAQACESAAYVAVTKALCGVAGAECVPQPVQDLRGCATWNGNSLTPDVACVREVVIDAACGGSGDDCALRDGAVGTLLGCGDSGSDCGQALASCQAGPSPDCTDGLRSLAVSALCDTDPAVCFAALDDELGDCETDGCRAAVLLRAACGQAAAACTPELRQLEPCVDGSATCDATFFRQWLGRACFVRGGATLNTLCPRNPLVQRNANVHTLPDGSTQQVPFENGSTQFAYRQVQQAVTDLNNGGTNTSWALASPVKIRAGTYNRVVVPLANRDEVRPLILLKDGSGDVVIEGGTQSGLSLPAGRVVLLGSGVTVTGTGPAVQGPAGSMAIAASQARVNSGEPALFTLSDALAVMPAPEPLLRRLRIHGASLGVTVEVQGGAGWTPVAAGPDGSYTVGTVSDTMVVAETGTSHPYAATYSGASTSVRVTGSDGGALGVTAELAGAHSQAVYASASAQVHVVVGQPYVEPTSSPRPPTAPPAPGPLPGEGNRLSGSDRSATAAAVSRSSYGSGADVVYVATGAAYADALAAGPAAVRSGGPVLLVERDRLPDATRDEIRRLSPRKVVLLGGTQAISQEVEDELAGLADAVDRLKGRDRYATAAAVSAAHFDSGVPVAYIASGEGFADALSGGAAAAYQRGPVLLVQPDAIPAGSAQELDRLKPQRIVVLGGEKAVSESVALKLRAYTTGTVQRVSGSTRYGTSAAISRHAFAQRVGTVYVATGESFPDALAGVPAAGAAGAPLLLVQTDQLPQEVAAELDRLRPQRIVILGGERAVSLRLERELRSYES